METKALAHAKANGRSNGVFAAEVADGWPRSAMAIVSSRHLTEISLGVSGNNFSPRQPCADELAESHFFGPNREFFLL